MTEGSFTIQSKAPAEVMSLFSHRNKEIRVPVTFDDYTSNKWVLLLRANHFWVVKLARSF